jgi:hypothetical protein
MFRTAHRSSSGAINCICSLWFICPYGDRPLPRLSGKWLMYLGVSSLSLQVLLNQMAAFILYNFLSVFLKACMFMACLAFINLILMDPCIVDYSVAIPTRCSFVIEFIILKFFESSTCFERHTAHHQDL